MSTPDTTSLAQSLVDAAAEAMAGNQQEDPELPCP
jgi:hypothetical protein